MSIESETMSLVRAAAREAYAAGVHNTAMTKSGDAIVAQGLPPLTELARLGLGWSTRTPLANAFQPVAAMPTTLANLVLYNGHASKALVVTNVWAVAATSVGAATSLTLLAQISNTGVAAPTDNTAALITSRSGKTYGGSTKRAIANSAFAVADRWTVVGESPGHPSTAIGAGAFADLQGGWVVPPAATFCVNLVASTAGGTMLQGVDWFEVDLDLG
jgi:hypothetical protein